MSFRLGRLRRGVDRESRTVRMASMALSPGVGSTKANGTGEHTRTLMERRVGLDGKMDFDTTYIPYYSTQLHSPKHSLVFGLL